MRLLSSFLLLVLIGCGRSQPIVSHGKPTSHWVEQLKSKDPQARRKAVEALGHAAAAAPEARAPLVNALQDADNDVRYQACVALVQLGKQTPAEALPLLEKATTDPDEKIQAAAKKALERVRGPTR